MDYRSLPTRAAVLLTLLITLSFGLLQAAGPEQIRIGVEDGYPPYSFIDEEGRPAGFSVDLIRASLQELGLEPLFVIGPWSGLQRLLSNGAIDVLPVVARIPEREKIFDFSIPYQTMHAAIAVRSGSPLLGSFDQLAGRRVGVLEGDSLQTRTAELVKEVELISFETYEEALRGLSHGDLDAVVIQRLVALHLLTDHRLENLRIGSALKELEQTFSFAVREGDSELLALLNEGLAVTISNGTFEELQARWFAPERFMLRRYDRLVVGGDDSYPPYEYIDEEGQPAGFNVDLTRAIARHLDIPVEIRLGPWNEVYQDFLDGEVDVMQGLLYSSERDRIISFSQPHTSVQYVPVIRNDGPLIKGLEDLEGLTILVQRYDVMHEYALEQGLEDQLLPVENQREALQQLAAGRADCALVAQLPAYYIKDELQLTHLVIGNTPVYSTDYNYGTLVRNRQWLQRFSEGLAAVERSGEYRTIYSRWLQVYEERQAITDTQLRRLLLLWGGPVLLLIILVTAWIWAMRRQVARRTAELNEKVSELEQTRGVLAERERKFRDVFNHLADPVAIVDTRGTIREVNDAACRVLGYRKDELENQQVPEVIEQMDAEAMHRFLLRMLRERDVTTEKTVITKSGKRIPYEINSSMIVYESRRAILTVSRDLSERRLHEQVQQRADRLDSLGILAGGIAHDFNNLLGGLFGYIELAQSSLHEPAEAGRYLEEGLKAFSRTRDLTRQLLTFAKGGEPRRETGRLEELVRESADFALSGSSVTCDYWLPDDLWPVDFDRHQMGQVIDNLVINAVQAMEGSGSIAISMENRLEMPGSPEQSDTPGCVLVRVADTGPGMSDEMLNHIFEPYYSTKTNGSGLGLATVYSIIDRHQGAIEVSSKQGEGSVFTLYLPRSEYQHDASGGNEVSREPGTEAVGTVLVMDDEHVIRDITTKMLQILGYRTLAAADGREALEMIGSDEQRTITAALFDLTIPGNMGGRETVAEVRKVREDLVIFSSSGYSDDPIMANPRAYGFTDSIAKPYRLQELSELLARYLS